MNYNLLYGIIFMNLGNVFMMFTRFSKIFLVLQILCLLIQLVFVYRAVKERNKQDNSRMIKV